MTLEEATKEMTVDEAIKDLEKIKKVKFSPISQPVSMDMAIDALKATRWIPVSEQLPAPGVFVLVSTRQKTGASVVRIGVFSGTSYGWSCGGASKNVVAWMPLPEPYEVA